RWRPEVVDLAAAIHLLGETLGDVVRTQEADALVDTEERIRVLAKALRGGEVADARELADAVATLSTHAARVTASAFAVYFDLVNLAEEGHRIRALRERERARHPAPIPGSIGAAIAELAARGVSGAQVAALLGGPSIGRVPTALPARAQAGRTTPASRRDRRRRGAAGG